MSRYRLNPPSSADDDWLDVLRRAAYRELSNTTCGRRDDSRHPPHFSDTWEGGHFLVVEVGGNPIGIIQVSESRGSIEIAEIRIGADPGSCEPGAGGLREQIADARRFGKPVTLYLSPENSPARRLYERLGFTETGRSETEIIMERRHASIIDSHDAAIFDCDGVLVNSELIAQKIELELLESVGMNYPRDEYVRRFSGTSETTFRAGLLEDSRARFGVELEADFFDRMDAAIDSAYETRLAAINGVHALLAAWPKAKAVASSSSLRSIRNKLQKTGLTDFFGQHVYSADCVRAGKPDPALFLYAADQLRVQPSRCVVIEDSVNGIIAAKRAGMRAVGFTGGGHCLANHAELLLANGADGVFGAHADLASELRL